VIKKDEKPKIKFRGSFSVVGDYMFEIQDGVNPRNHFLPSSYKAKDYTDNGDPDNAHHTTKGRVIGGTYGGLQLETYYDYYFILPFLQVDNPLMKNNSLSFGVHTAISPLTFNEGFSVTWSPVAFLNFKYGLLLGFGWNIPGFAAGFGLNDNGVIKRPDVAGPQLMTWFSGTFQIDLAYLMPKALERWTHIVAVATPTFKYQGLLTISDNQPFMYQECPGEKLNGWKFIFEGIFGYRFYVIEDDTGENQMFLKRKNKNFIITVGAYVWLDYLNLTHYYDSPMKNGWGSDFAYVNFGPAMQFDLPNNYFLKLFFFFQNDKAYTSETVGNADFRERKYEDWYVYYKWMGFFFGWNF
jgi:hypothetical protein